MYKKLNSLIKKYETIIIHRHQKPDGDALGSQFGLAELIKINFENKKIFTVGNLEEFQESSIRNIFKEDFNNPTKEDYEKSLVIVVDTANVERIEGTDFFRGEEVIKIDHHVSTEEYGTLEIIENTISSTCEIITNMATELKWDFNKDAAYYLMTGLVTDTGRFMFNSVKAPTFKAAMTLSENGAKISKIANSLNDRNLSFTRLQGKILTDLSFKDGIAYYQMPKGLHKKYNVSYNTASSLVFLLMSFTEAEYGVYATYDSKKSVWKGSLRSKKKPINQIAENYNGGGHEMAAGFKFKDKKQFLEVLDEVKKLKNK